MNRLEFGDVCKPRNFEEYLLIHKLFGENNIKCFKTYEVRLSEGDITAQNWPYLGWTCDVELAGVYHYIQLLTVEAFLFKAGVNPSIPPRIKHNNGKPLKHNFV
jgi:hypothetical protein